jgi:acetoacetyl-CoA synthetase
MVNTVCWKPDPEKVRDSTASRFIAHVKSTSPSVIDFESLYQYSIGEPEEFWSNIWEFFDVIGTPGETVLTDRDRMPGARFFPQASLSFAENLLRFRDDRDAIVFRSDPSH